MNRSAVNSDANEAFSMFWVSSPARGLGGEAVRPAISKPAADGKYHSVSTDVTQAGAFEVGRCAPTIGIPSATGSASGRKWLPDRYDTLWRGVPVEVAGRRWISLPRSSGTPSPRPSPH